MTARRPDLDDLAVLVQVAKVGSIGQVAAQLGMSQPSVSRRMTALEKFLRVSLLQRTRRGTTLTPTGRVVVDWASTLLAAADDFTRSVQTLRDQRAVAVRAAVSMTIAEHYAPGWLATLHSRSPESVVSLMVHNSTEVAELVETGAADVGFLESPTVRRTLHRRRIGWDKLTVAVPPDHEWAGRRRPVTAKELAGAPLLVREPGSGTRETVDTALKREGLELSPGLVMASNTALKSAALAGMGPVVLSDLALASELEHGQLVQVRLSDLTLRRPLSAVWRRDEPLSPSAASLLEVAGQSRR
jgi:DNA-binding transcriptional LysR family regulator